MPCGDTVNHLNHLACEALARSSRSLYVMNMHLWHLGFGKEPARQLRRLDTSEPAFFQASNWKTKISLSRFLAHVNFRSRIPIFSHSSRNLELVSSPRLKQELWLSSKRAHVFVVAGKGVFFSGVSGGALGFRGLKV